MSVEHHFPHAHMMSSLADTARYAASARDGAPSTARDRPRPSVQESLAALRAACHECELRYWDAVAAEETRCADEDVARRADDGDDDGRARGDDARRAPVARRAESAPIAGEASGAGPRRRRRLRSGDRRGSWLSDLGFFLDRDQVSFPAE